MRNAFAAELTKLGAELDSLVLLSGDIGNKLFDDYKLYFPKRFLNCGVAEANMIGVAAGMAQCGLRPVAYTINSFITTRCLEQIRLDVCYQNVPVILAGVGSGLSYAGLGSTHHSCEDIAVLRVLPNMTVVCPGDATEVRLALRAALQQGGPVYIRLGKKGEPRVHTDVPRFKIGKGIVVCTGKDVCLVSTGNMLPVAVQAADELARRGVSAQVVSMHTVKPLDEELLAEAFWRFSAVVTLEEHSMHGGLGGSVAEWLADRPPQRARLCRIGTADSFLQEAGEQDYAREHFGLTAANVTATALRLHSMSTSKRASLFLT
jgi:transketolase